nr:transposase [Streptomyces sp. NBC_01762]
MDTACRNANQLEEATAEAFEQHPNAPIIRSFPGLGSLTGARVLAEIGDDRTRFANAGSLKAYAGSAPVTRASGKSCVVMSRRVKNQRLASVGNVWRPSSRSRGHPAPEPTTTAERKPETAMSPHSETRLTASWECSSTPSRTESPTTKRGPSPITHRRSSPLKQLDSLSAWDVSFSA